jgi:nucleotide-binding universal stress UspA family protein
MSRMVVGQQVVVGVDGTDDGRRAAAFGAAEAHSRGCRLRLVHAYHASAALNPMLPLYGVESLRESGERAVEAAAAEILQSFPDLRVTSAVVQGNPSGVLVDASASACLVVVGRSALSGVGRVFAGSTSTAVAARSTCPVVIVPADWHLGDGQRIVVVGLDGSTRSHEAVALAFESASRMDASLFAVQAWEMPNWGLSNGHHKADEIDAWADRAQLLLAEELAGWSEQYPNVHIVRIFEQSRPAEALVRRARGAALLVIGARGLGGVPGLQLGSTARSVLAHAPCPVMIVRARQKARRRLAAEVPEAVPALDLTIPTY